MLDQYDASPSCVPSALDLERLKCLTVDGKVESEAIHRSGMNMFAVFRYPLTARHKHHAWPEHYLVFWIDKQGHCRQTDTLVRIDAVITWLKSQ